MTHNFKLTDEEKKAFATVNNFIDKLCDGENCENCPFDAICEYGDVWERFDYMNNQIQRIK